VWVKDAVSSAFVTVSARTAQCGALDKGERLFRREIVELLHEARWPLDAQCVDDRALTQTVIPSEASGTWRRIP